MFLVVFVLLPTVWANFECGQETINIDIHNGYEVDEEFVAPDQNCVLNFTWPDDYIAYVKVNAGLLARSDFVTLRSTWDDLTHYQEIRDYESLNVDVVWPKSGLQVKLHSNSDTVMVLSISINLERCLVVVDGLFSRVIYLNRQNRSHTPLNLEGNLIYSYPSFCINSAVQVAGTALLVLAQQFLSGAETFETSKTASEIHLVSVPLSDVNERVKWEYAVTPGSYPTIVNTKAWITQSAISVKAATKLAFSTTIPETSKIDKMNFFMYERNENGLKFVGTLACFDQKFIYDGNELIIYNSKVTGPASITVRDAERVPTFFDVWWSPLNVFGKIFSHLIY